MDVVGYYTSFIGWIRELFLKRGGAREKCSAVPYCVRVSQSGKGVAVYVMCCYFWPRTAQLEFKLVGSVDDPTSRGTTWLVASHEISNA